MKDEEMDEILNKFVVDIYNNKKKYGLGGEKKEKEWKSLENERWINKKKKIIERNVVFGVKIKRKIGRKGVIVNGIN